MFLKCPHYTFQFAAKLENVAQEKNVNPVFKTNQTQLLTMIKNELKERAEKRGTRSASKKTFSFFADVEHIGVDVVF